MRLDHRISRLIFAYAEQRSESGLTALQISAPDCWHLDLAFAMPGQGAYRVRNLRGDDVPQLRRFGDGLGAQARDYFAPYPWQEPAKLPEAFQAAIRNAVTHVDASYLMLRDGEPIGHFFLWRAGGNEHARAHGLELPELGIAIVDTAVGKGLGGLAVRLLTAVAESLHADGIELTTAMENEAGWQTYLRAGYEYTGQIWGALDVDVTAAFAGEVTPTRFRLERQMIYYLQPEKKPAILAYLALKRQQAEAQYRACLAQTPQETP